MSDVRREGAGVVVTVAAAASEVGGRWYHAEEKVLVTGWDSDGG